jgi:tellurium resistance protein TerD
MALTLTLTKPGTVAPKLALNLSKPARFTIELYWDSAHDLDAHALLATNHGDGAKVSAFEQVLSTYNSRKTNAAGVLETNPDGSFSTPEGALRHSGDCRNGLRQDVDEVITIDGARVPPGVNEIPIFVTIHPAQSARFAQVARAGIRIKSEAGTVLGEYALSEEFGAFDAVQMGSLLLDANGWTYHATGVGFQGDLNAILAYFS